MRNLKIIVGIATTGRKSIVGCTLDLLRSQTRLPDGLVMCPASAEDFDPDTIRNLPFATTVRSGKRGLTAQRNQILSAAEEADLIVFFDDDFFPRPNYLEVVEQLFVAHADIVAITGRPIKDGANGPGIEIETALSLMAEERSATDELAFAPTYGTYGCNMAFRMDPIRKHGIQFDENLPLYGWQEDIDFSRQLSVFGRIIDARALRGIHLGAKGGRSSGVRLGYSQIANPIYLVRKGTVSFQFAAPLVFRNVIANLIKSFRSEPWIDRRGRLRGNCLAMRDFFTGRLSPQRILELP
jgi:hypothetical protein